MNFIRTPMKFLILLCFPFVLSAQSDRTELSASLNVRSEDGSASELLAGRDQWQEVVSKRKLTESTYTTPDGRVIIKTSSKPINYYNANGELVPIDPKLKKMESGKGWCATDQPYPVYVYPDGSYALSGSNGQLFSFGRNCRVNGEWNYGEPFTDVGADNRIMMKNVVPGVNKFMEVRENGIKYNYVINSPQHLSSQNFEISEEYDIPDGYYLQRDNSEGREENGGWTGNFEIISPDKHIDGVIYAPIIFDANQQWMIGTYILGKENGRTIIKLVIPNAWLNDPSRAYPVTIDPLIVGPTSYWVGGYMPSCISPAYNTDSIYVDVPGQITVTGLVVTSSFYADPFTSAVMADGAMWFSTSCNQTQQFVITGPAGNLPGTAYLDTFNMRSPLMCCYPQSCTPFSFWLRMHLSRSQWGSGCNTTYIRHDPTTTSWPYQAYIVGHTVEPFGSGFTVQSAPICSRQCTFTGNVYIHYGVPPFTITHPWLTSAITVGNPAGCSFATTNQPVTFHIPNCPVFCDTATHLQVQPPVVTDACGNTASGLPVRNLNIKPTPSVTVSPDPDSICSGENYSFIFTPCLAGSTVTWSDGSVVNIGNISGTGTNTGTSDTVVVYNAFASLNGCISDTINTYLVIDPQPVAGFGTNPSPCISGLPVSFFDQSIFYAGSGSFWTWDFGDNSSPVVSANPVHTYANPGTYTVCMTVTTTGGCTDSICRVIDVIPAEVETINVVTPNSDGINDLLVFKYLEFYTNNHLVVYDRWGVPVFSKDSYMNDLDCSKFSDGTYYYVLDVNDTGKSYTGFFEIIK